MKNNLEFEPLYPDVLGTIAGGLRVNFEDVLQAAVGIFPHTAYLNQPVEVVVILQSLIDQNMDVKVALHAPTKLKDGSKLMISMPQKMASMTLSPGEAGVLRLPLVTLLPTQAINDLPLQVAIRQRSRPAKLIRSISRGAPPSTLEVSPFKLHVLRDIEWVDHPANLSPENITVKFSLAAHRLPALQQSLKSSYEVLWTQEQMREERRHLQEHLGEARVLATSFTRQAVYNSLLRAVDERYAAGGLVLHPGEAKAITKMLVYTLDDRSELDQTYKIEEQRWFQTLCQVLAYDSSVAQWSPGEIVTRYLFEPTMFEAIPLAFSLVRPRVKVNLGDRAERLDYAERVLRWLAGHAEAEQVFIYLPLALAGVIVNHQVTGQGDDPWQLIDQLRDAYRGRVRLVAGEAVEVFDLLDSLLEQGEEDLRRARIPR